MEKADLLRIRVVYALPDQQASVDLELAPGTALEDAVTRSGLLQKFPEAAQQPLACAIFGRSVPLTYELRDGDRIEILRPLLIDPKQSRREAAKRSRAETGSRK
ncbi:RnfH family protein [Steroidobacter sp.]|uniref:RnfH family protein n=1 Tax=Steroidobacter sp. TaxID=1978227 RepID=UPI001A535097|nr:RnfH family protein [Steroidobacter sp.]MBL8270630.1 RnfH family protein [Steroidobacter sp.]